MSLATARVAPTVATFEGSFEPGKGLTIRTVPVATPDAMGRVVAILPYQDNNPGMGPDDSFELVTDASPAPVPNGAGCGGVGSFDGHITLRSFYKTQAFTDVAIELTSVSTGHEACNSVAAYGGMSSAYGLWSYGGIGTAGSGTSFPSRLWQFRYATSEAFTFRGRIMAQFASLPLPPSGASEFDWRPYMFDDPPHSFQDVGTTISHVIWNGSSFVDTKGVATFLPVGAAAPDHQVGLSYPAQHWAGPFASGANRYEASPSPAALNLAGNFTVCAKFKPGVNPPEGGRKVLVAKGNPVDRVGPGWALTQQHGIIALGGGAQYGFFYNTMDPLDGNTDSFVFPGNNPGNSTFDYSCGGRSGDGITVVAHGRDMHFTQPVHGAFPDVAALPLEIGAAADGLWPATDAGVYEVIFDSRGATLAVMNDIVDRAEGRKSYNGASYDGNEVDALGVNGVDGVTYHFPVGSTAPVSADGSGLLDVGTGLTFGGGTNGLTGVFPLTTSDYCVGAELANPSDVNFASAAGYILTDTSGYLKLFINPDGTVIGVNGKDAFSQPQDVGLHLWAANTRHTLRVCATALGTGNLRLYVDSDTPQWIGNTSGAPLADLTNGRLFVGSDNGGGSLLAGARIGRVFACPTADPTLCH